MAEQQSDSRGRSTLHPTMVEPGDRYELRIARPVLEECSLVDPDAVREKLDSIQGISLLEESPEVIELTGEVFAGLQIPASAATDAMHIALAAFHQCAYLLTWNCRYIANPANERKLETVLSNPGLPMPVICTPGQLLTEDA